MVVFCRFCMFRWFHICSTFLGVSFLCFSFFIQLLFRLASNSSAHQFFWFFDWRSAVVTDYSLSLSLSLIGCLGRDLLSLSLPLPSPPPLCVCLHIPLCQFFCFSSIQSDPSHSTNKLLSFIAILPIVMLALSASTICYYCIRFQY